MSLYDLTRLTGASPVRGVGRDFSGARAETRSTPAEKTADKGITVQTGARAEAGSAPVDQERVAQIRSAIRDGNYPISPAKITDAMIAARLMLSQSQ